MFAPLRSSPPPVVSAPVAPAPVTPALRRMHLRDSSIMDLRMYKSCKSSRRPLQRKAHSFKNRRPCKRTNARQVVRETALALRAMGACNADCWLWPSITQRSYQTAEILGALLGVGRSRIVPEYSFLDPRCATRTLLPLSSCVPHRAPCLLRCMRASFGKQPSSRD
jgi:hypothetical protein